MSTVQITMATARLVTIGDIAKALSVSRQRADQLSRQTGFPTPASEGLQGRRWALRDVQRWAREQGRTWKADPGH